jgi:hypothetical protein
MIKRFYLFLLLRGRLQIAKRRETCSLRIGGAHVQESRPTTISSSHFRLPKEKKIMH